MYQNIKKLLNKKKYFYLLMLAMIPICFVACGSDDDEPTGVEGVETLYGTWQQTHGVAFEDGAFHHDNDVGADEAEYLRFDKSGTCAVIGGDRGVFYSNGTYSFTLNEESKGLRIGSQSLVVEVLSGGTLKLKYYSASDEYILTTYKKVSDSVWNNLREYL
jgi:hypothetical protein